MKVLLFFVVVIALGSANPIGPTTTDTSEPSRDDRIKTAIDRNVQWLLSGIRNGSFVGPDLPRAVVAIFLAEPGFFYPGHEIGQELRVKIETTLTELIRQRQIQAEDPESGPWKTDNTAPSFIPYVELALYLQALLVSCVNPYDFLGYDMTKELNLSVIRHHCYLGFHTHCTFPSLAMLARCNARDTSLFSNHVFQYDGIDANGDIRPIMSLTDEEEFITMTIGCLESSNYPYPTDMPSAINLRNPLPTYRYYRHYPSKLTIEDFHEMVKADGDPLGNTTSLFGIAAAMQNLMYKYRLRVSDLPLGVDFLLNSQDEDGSWGQSTLNSFFVLPVLSNKSFLDIASDHCSEGSENKTLVAKEGVEINIVLDCVFSPGFSDRNSPDTSLYGALTTSRSKNAWYHHGMDGKPYLYSLINRDNNPETGYFWFTYEQTKWPKESFTLLTQSHADIQLKRSSNYLLWYRKRTEEDHNEIEAGF